MEETDTTVTTSEVDADTSVNEVVDTDTTVTDDTTYSMDDLLKLTMEDYEEFQDEANHKGMRPLHELMKHLPEDARKHLANMRSSYTIKTQALAAAKSEAERELKLEREAIATERASLYTGDVAKNVNDLATSQDEFDIYDPEGMKKEIQRQAALMMQQMMAPAQEKLATDTRRNEMQRFATEHPDLKSDDYRMPIAEMLRDRPELKLEDAYYIVKAKVDSSKLAQERNQIAEEKENRRSTFQKTSTGSTAKPTGTPKFTDAWSSYQWHKANQSKD